MVFLPSRTLSGLKCIPFNLQCGSSYSLIFNNHSSLEIIIDFVRKTVFCSVLRSRFDPQTCWNKAYFPQGARTLLLVPSSQKVRTIWYAFLSVCSFMNSYPLALLLLSVLCCSEYEVLFLSSNPENHSNVPVGLGKVNLLTSLSKNPFDACDAIFAWVLSKTNYSFRATLSKAFTHSLTGYTFELVSSFTPYLLEQSYSLLWSFALKSRTDNEWPQSSPPTIVLVHFSSLLPRQTSHLTKKRISVYLSSINYSSYVLFAPPEKFIHIRVWAYLTDLTWFRFSRWQLVKSKARLHGDLCTPNLLSKPE